MKKLIALLLALVMVLSLTACGGDKPVETSPRATPVRPPPVRLNPARPNPRQPRK